MGMLVKEWMHPIKAHASGGVGEQILKYLWNVLMHFYNHIFLFCLNFEFCYSQWDTDKDLEGKNPDRVFIKL